MVALTLTITFESYGQQEESSTTLRNQWAEMIKSSETYNDYKIIKINKLQEFRSVMGDSLSSYTGSLESLKSEKEKVATELEYLKTDLEQVRAQLLASQAQIDSIGLLGISMGKNTYNVVVWSIIAVLGAVVFIIYARIKRVCEVVKRVKTAYSKISDEYRNHRYEAKENQIKLKRELQTALNKLELAD